MDSGTLSERYASASTGACAKELELLLRCLRSDTLLEVNDPLVNWPCFVQLADWHGVLPIVAARLRDNFTPPQDIAERLSAARFTSATRNLFLASEMSKLAATLEGEKIPFIPWKGIVLSQELYESLAPRAIKDLDIIVRRRDVPRAIKCLSKLGYVDLYSLTSAQQEFAIRHGHEHTFVRGDVAIDLHWSIASKFTWPSLEEDKLWSNLRPLPLNGRVYRVLAPELSLAALCIQCAQDDWTKLKTFVDVSQILIKSGGIDWKQFNSLLADSHARRGVLISLKLAHDHLAAPLAAELVTALEQDAQIREIAKRVYEDRWPQRMNPMLRPTDLRWLLFRSKGEGWRDRCRYILAVAFGVSMADLIGTEFPSSLSWLYFLLRPFRIARSRLRRSLGNRTNGLN